MDPTAPSAPGLQSSVPGMSPAMKTQLMAYNRAQMPGYIAQNIGNAQPGQAPGVGAGNALSKLALGLMGRNAMAQYHQMYNATPNLSQNPSQP